MDPSTLVTAVDVARLAGVGRAAVSNWRRRHSDFPQPVGGTDSSPQFRLVEVSSWLQVQGKLGMHSLVELAWQAIEVEAGSGSSARTVAAVGDYLRGAGGGLSDGTRTAVDDLAAAVGGATAFERLCARFGEATSRQLMVTPPELASLMIELAGVDNGPVLDPACGAGALLRAAPSGAEVHGQELDPALADLARARLTFSHGEVRIAAGDAIRADQFLGMQASAVVCNPPFNARDWGHDDLQFDPRWVYGLPPRSESELAWVQHCLAHLRPGGRVVIVLPPGVASRRSGRSIRAALLRRGVLRGVISLPPGAVAPAHLPMQLWILAVGDGEPTDRAWLVDTTGGESVRLDDIGWAEVARRATSHDADPAVCRLVPTIDLLDDDVDLTPGRHLRPPADVTSLDADRDRFVAALGGLAELLPQLAQAHHRSNWSRTTVGELARQGALTVHQQVGSAAVGSAPGRPVLTSGDVIAGRRPSAYAADDVAGVVIQRGDVVVPTIASHPVAMIVEEEAGALLGTGLQLLRAHPEHLDARFLAGVLRSGETLRAATTRSGSYRVDVRRVELPRLGLAEQRRLGEVLASLRQFGAAVDDLTTIGRRLVQGTTDAVVSGRLEPEGEDR